MALSVDPHITRKARSRESFRLSEFPSALQLEQQEILGGLSLNMIIAIQQMR